MDNPITYFITWTTYGTWLPGDHRGWRKRNQGYQPPQPLLEDWVRGRLTEKPVLLNTIQRKKVEDVCCDHANMRGWVIHAVSARSNHVHIAVTADVGPQKVRDQFKANATRILRQNPDPITNERVWTKGGDCEIIDGEDELERVILYINEAQDQMDKGK